MSSCRWEKSTPSTARPRMRALASWAEMSAPPGPNNRPSPSRTDASARSESPIQTTGAPGSCRGRERQADQRRTPLPLVPGPGHGQGGAGGLPGAEAVRGLVGGGQRVHDQVEGIAGVHLGPGRNFPSLDRLQQPVPQGAELEEVEQPPQLLTVPTAHGQLVQVRLQGDFAHQRRGLGVGAHRRLGLGQVGPQLGGQVVQVGEDPVQIAVGVDEAGGGLVPHPRHAGQVVGRVAAQRGVLGVLGRGDPRALGDPRLVVQDVVRHPPAVVQDLDVRVLDQLVGVPVARHDDDVVAPIAGLGGEGGDDIVGLVAGGFHDRHVHGLHHLADQTQLLAQDVGGLGPPRLVVAHHLVAERGLGTVERHRDAVRLVVLEQVDEHGREAVDGVGDLPRRGGHVRRQGEEGPVGQRVPVQKHEPRHPDDATAWAHPSGRKRRAAGPAERRERNGTLASVADGFHPRWRSTSRPSTSWRRRGRPSSRPGWPSVWGSPRRRFPR